MMEYKYGFRHARGFGPMCQPREGLLRREDDISGKYWDVAVYNRKLTQQELYDYELDEITVDLDELGERLDAFYKDYDPYEYADTEANAEKAKMLLEESPLTVIKNLLDILENM